MNLKYLKYVVGTSVILATVCFFVNRLVMSWGQLKETTDFSFSIWGILAIIFMVLAVLLSGLLWGKILNEIEDNYKISDYESIRVHIGAWLLKYVPGQVGSVVYKISWGKKHGIAKSKIGWSFVYENLYLTVASTAVPAVILLLSRNLNHLVETALLIIVIFVSLVILNNRLLMRLFVSISHRLKILKKIEPSSIKSIFKFSIYYHIPRLINGVGFVFVAVSLYNISTSDILILIAAYTLAGIIGIYAIFVPSGLGVREAMIVLFTSGILPTEQAVLLAIAARFYATLSDGMLFMVFAKLSSKKVKVLS